MRLHRPPRVRSPLLTAEMAADCDFELRGPCGSFTCVCRDANPVDSSSVIGFDRLATESCRVTSRGCLGQNVGQRRKLFGHRRPAVSFLSRGQKQAGLQVESGCALFQIFLKERFQLFKWDHVHLIVSSSIIARITRHGLPTATELSGISLTTTLPPPITTLLPIVTPGMT